MVNRTEKTCRKKQHVHIYKNKEMPILICGVVAVGEKDKSTHYIEMKMVVVQIGLKKLK